MDPTDASTSGLTLVPERVLTNTLEQLVLFVGATAILATHLEEEGMGIVPVLILTWSLGRVLFAYGYIFFTVYHLQNEVVELIIY